MKARFTLHSGDYTADLRKPLDISIPVRFGGEQLSVFGAPPARREPYRAGSFTGDVGQGGSCNCETFHFTPHINGTHTECVGHITRNEINVPDVLVNGLMPAALITVDLVRAADSDESYSVPLRPDDLLVTRKTLENVMLNLFQHPSQGREIKEKWIPKQVRDDNSALILRTLPNPPDKQTRDYNAQLPPFFSTEAMRYIHELGVPHLLVDFPSIDRTDDGGGLSNHRIFWDVAPEIVDIAPETASQRTVTELVYVPDSVVDGLYLLDLQVAPFMADAAPSRPILYALT